MAKEVVARREVVTMRDLMDFINGIAFEFDPELINVESQTFGLQVVCLIKETLTDGSVVHNLVIS